jgi:hypothetical protein
MRRRIMLTVAATLLGAVFQGISCLNIAPAYLADTLLQ